MSEKIPLTIGFANLSGDDLNSMALEDVAALAPLFVKSREVPAHQIPSAEILFVYAHLNDDGTIKGSTQSGIRQIIELTNAAIIVLASPNSSSKIQSAVALPGPKTANLIFTLDRNGIGFSRFFRELFEKMRSGKNMLTAWVELAPQNPNANSSYAPQTLLLAEGGKIAFPVEQVITDYRSEHSSSNNFSTALQYGTTVPKNNSVNDSDTQRFEYRFSTSNAITGVLAASAVTLGMGYIAYTNPQTSMTRGLSMLLSPEAVPVIFWVITVACFFATLLALRMAISAPNNIKQVELRATDALVPKASVSMSAIAIPYQTITGIDVQDISGGRMAVIKSTVGESRLIERFFVSSLDFNAFVSGLKQRRGA